MIAGPGVCICNECIELCQEVLDGEKSRSTEPKQKKEAASFERGNLQPLQENILKR